MIHYFEGTVFNAPVKTIVNTVNCMGFMGAGIALEFKLRYPAMNEDYKIKCEKKEVKLARPYVYECSDKVWILNFPTKGHWREFCLKEEFVLQHYLILYVVDWMGG